MPSIAVQGTALDYPITKPEYSLGTRLNILDSWNACMYTR